MVGSAAEVFPDAAYQRRAVHFYRNVLAKVPKSKRPRVVAMPRRSTPWSHGRWWRPRRSRWPPISRRLSSGKSPRWSGTAARRP
ncbi:transposase [Candidatus Collinsella stercoripullorum]|uniref:transposase n=1 Tax=Candidatus Collinsella stercoripullorum TaxID=2838522 RepID=UPI0038CC0DAD